MLSRILLLTSLLSAGACDSVGKNEKGGSYDFKISAKANLTSTNLKTSSASLFNFADYEDGPGRLCRNTGNLTCISPSNISGIYYSVGLLLQAQGNGILSYLITDTLSEVDSSSTPYQFDFKTPIETLGTLKCCSGNSTIDESTYFSDAYFLFGYIDASFEVPYPNTKQVVQEMLGTHTIRFILAEGAISGSKRGDLLYKDSDGAFKWVDQAGTLSTTRPSNPITMDTKVVNWQPDSAEGNQTIPVISTIIRPPEGGNQKVAVTEDELKQEGRTYTFDFDPQYLLLVFLDESELGIIQSKSELLKRIHIHGLPHSTSPLVSASGDSVLEVKGP